MKMPKLVPTSTYYADMAPQTLKPKHFQMIMLEALGCTVQEIAHATGFSCENVYIVRQNEVFQREVAKLRERIQSECIQRAVEQLNLHVLNAVETIASTMNDPNAPKALRLKAAQDILNRVPATSITLRQFSNPSGKPQMTADELDSALERGKELLNNLPELQLSTLQNARQRALQELTQIDEALAQKAGE
jgi:hypothetical protein